MKFNVISDIHCNPTTKHNKYQKVTLFGFEPKKLKPADYLIIAGDLGLNSNYKDVHALIKEETKDLFKDVLFVRGNHDYYTDLRVNDETDFISNKYLEIVDNGVAIIGCTLWTPYSGQIYNELRYMNDFHLITNPDKDPLIFGNIFREESEWLRQKCAKYKSKGLKVVIVTHHNPRSYKILPEHEIFSNHLEVAKAYWADDELLDIKPDLWVCGHIHTCIDTEYDGVRFVRNPIGYRWNYIENPSEKWYTTIVEV